ncbi:MAG: hypothetical protein O2976_05215 [Actinomycetota bacterium]|nr:hypothetical protein [Actinomycetota bacterium]
MKRSAAAPARKPRVPTPDELDARLIARLHRLAAFFVETSRETSADRPYFYTEASAALLLEQAPRIAEIQRGEILDAVATFVPKQQWAAVLSRDVLTARWPVSEAVKAMVPSVVEALTAWNMYHWTPPGDLAPGAFPAEVALLPATEWAMKKATGPFKAWLAFAATSLKVGIGYQARYPGTTLQRGNVFHHGRGWVSPDTFPMEYASGIVVETDDTFDQPALDLWDQWTMAVLNYQAVHDVERDRGRPFIAVDASAPHVAFLDGLATALQPVLRGRPTLNRRHAIGRVELLAPGHIVQLSLALDMGAISERVTTLIYTVLGPRALRHYAALLTRLTTDGHRSGTVAWDVEAHLHTMGVKPEEYRHERKDAIETMRAFSQLEVAVYDQEHQVRLRQKLVTVGDERDIKDQNGAWETRGLELRYAPALYAGVRRLNGRQGRNFYPAPTGLSRVNEKTYPFAVAFGLKIAARFRMAVNERKDFIRLSGLNALKDAGIVLSAIHPARAWTSLRKNLDKLVEVGSLKMWRWTSHPDTKEGVVELIAPEWSTDRLLRGIAYVEPAADAVPATGAELAAWRTRQQLTADQAAALLGCHRNTIRNAERDPGQALTTRLRECFRRL